jgi:high-affinity nickel-transport protein
VTRLRRALGSLSPTERLKVAGMGLCTVALLASGAALLLAAAPHRYHLSGGAVFGLGTGILALTLGMRHAFDADHISAIDNTTRSLMGRGERPLSVGFFFALGHSTIVFALAVALGAGVRALGGQVRDGGSALHRVTTLVGTGVSGIFLYLIAALNIVILLSIVRTFVEMRRGRYDEAELERQLAQRGLMNRFFGRFARRIDAPWKMYPVGVLFGLGFDTATEVALLVVSGSAVASGLPFWAVLSLPLLFAGGMTLFDTLDGCFMNFAYGWAFSKPVRKVYYNLVITALSVAVALLVGTVELLGLLANELHLGGTVWHDLANFNLNAAGFAIAALFVVTWVIAMAIWRLWRIEDRWAVPLSAPEPLLAGAAMPAGVSGRDETRQPVTTASAKPS